MGYVGDGYHDITKHIIWQASTYHGQVSTRLHNLSFGCTLEGRKYNVISTSHSPFQFTLGQLSTMLTIYDNQGKGQNPGNMRQYFWSKNQREDTSQQLPLMMTTSHQFEENLILLCTMSEIKKVETKKNSSRKFCIRCLVKNYERGNTAIRKKHKTLFKDNVNHYNNFTGSNELLLTLPYKFVHDLKTGNWQRLPATWLNTIQRKVRPHRII
jgi:hypothetical protein